MRQTQRRIADIRRRTPESQIASVTRGTLYQFGTVVQVWWQIDGRLVRETWDAPSEDEAVANFIDMRERWTEAQTADQTGGR